MTLDVASGLPGTENRADGKGETLRTHLATVGALAAAAVLSLLHGTGEAHDVRVRRPLRLPDVPGYRTLQCDFHTHTVFSDGEVWPDVRSEEAWREGLDAVAITDHVEYRPHEADLPTNHERSFQIAAPHGEKLGLIVIRGSEITRKMPPGHLNAIFLDRVAPLDVPDWREALREARRQGAFVFWNHPGWTGHQPDGVARWYPEHTEIVEAGLVQGIEVVNERDYYPEAHRWSLERNLAPLANSDIHAPLNLEYHVHEGDHRPVTLVFAKERTAESIREALFARRTAAWSGNLLVGREELLRPLIAAAVSVENPRISAQAGEAFFVRLRNVSDLRLELVGSGAAAMLKPPKKAVAAANGTSLLELKVPKGTAPGALRVDLAYTIGNVRTAPDVGLPFTISVDVEVLTPGKPVRKTQP